MYYWEDYSSLWRRAAKTGEDATSKHVYGENENPYLRADAEATVTKRYNLVPVKHKSSICLTMLNYFK